MRLGTLVFATCALVLTAELSAQTYSRSVPAPATTVIRPMPVPGWRNYVTVPDGPCGCPMSVEADCYNGCGHCCGPLVLIHRVKRMFDCLLPCNLCCRGGCGGGCGPLHGCLLGGRTWGGCSVCCGGCGLGTPGGGGCCTNPCGSAFAPTCGAPTSGGHYHGCGCSTPAASDPFIDDPLPVPTPQPTAVPVPEVRRAPTYRTQPTRYQTQVMVPVLVHPASQKAAIAAAKKLPANDRVEAQSESQDVPAVSAASAKSSESVLRRVSAEQELREPAPLFIDYPAAKPIVRSQTPEAAVSSREIPHNPLRN